MTKFKATLGILRFKALLARSQVTSNARASRKAPVKGKKATSQVLDGRRAAFVVRTSWAGCTLPNGQKHLQDKPERRATQWSQG